MVPSRENGPDDTGHAAGRLVIGTLIFTSANIALASPAIDKAAGGMRYAVETSFSAAGKRFAPRFEVGEGESIEVHPDRAGVPLAGEFRVCKTGSDTTVQIRARIKNRGLTIAQPTLIGTLGQSAGILIDTADGPVELRIVVTELAP